MTPNDFDDQIRKFNELYRLPVLDVPGIPPLPGEQGQSTRERLLNRLDQFQKILAEELAEVEEIKNKVKAGEPPVEVLTDLADWLGDIQVYCASEMRKFGLDNAVILSTIMASNMSKLGVDGKPIYDDRGKVMKGPNFWPPEPMIRKYLTAAIRQAERQAELDLRVTK